MTWADRLLSLHLTWRDGADILIVALIIYSILALIRGTRAMQVSIGLVLLGSVFFLARALDLPALEAISRQILFYLPFAVVVLFQHEIRHALAQVGGSPLIALFRSRRPRVSYPAVLDACELLAAKRIGALIAVEGAQTLRMYEEGAKVIDGVLTSELLVNLHARDAVARWRGHPAREPDRRSQRISALDARGICSGARHAASGGARSLRGDRCVADHCLGREWIDRRRAGRGPARGSES